MSQRNRNVFRRAAFLAAAGIAVVAIVWWQWREPGEPPETLRAVSASANRSQAGNAPVTTAGSARDWSRWADGVGSFTAVKFQSLVEEALTIVDAGSRLTILSEILTAWLKADARGFNKYFMALEVADESGKLESIVAAMKLALPGVADRIATSQTLQEIVRRFMAHFARHDPAGALAWATTWLRGDPHDSALVQVLGPLAARDAVLARTEVEKVRSPLRRMQSLAAIGGNWARTDPVAAASWAAGIQAPGERAMAMNSVLLTLVGADLGDAASRLSTVARGMVGEYTVQYRNALAAMNLTELDVANNTEAYRDLLNDGAIPPPNSPDVELMAESARVIASKLAEANPLAATTWAASLDNEFLRLNAMKGALSGWIGQEPEAAVNHYQGSYGRYHDILASLYDTWTASNPVAAAAGVALLQSQTHRTLAIQSVARGWAASDATGAANWLDQLPVAERSDEARFAVVTALAPARPVEAWNRALEIANPSLQYKALKSAFGNLLAADPAQARGLLQQTTLPTTTSERLGEMVRAIE